MKNLLKYLLVLFSAVLVWGSEDGAAFTDRQDAAEEAYFQVDSFTSISSAESEFCLPRQVSSANTQRVQSNARRTTSLSRNNLEFARAGKIINAGLRYVIQNRSIIIHSSLSEPANLLLYLGKLII